MSSGVPWAFLLATLDRHGQLHTLTSFIPDNKTPLHRPVRFQNLGTWKVGVQMEKRAVTGTPAS